MDRSHTAPFFLSVPRLYGQRSQTGADKLERVCTVGLSVPVWDRSRTDLLSYAQGHNLLKSRMIYVMIAMHLMKTHIEELCHI